MYEIYPHIFARRSTASYAPLKASLIVWVPRALFHLPGFYEETGSALGALQVYGLFGIPELCSRVLVAWLYNNTNRSVLPVGLFHSAFNTTTGPITREFIPATAEDQFLIQIGGIIISVGPVEELASDVVGLGVGMTTARDGGHGQILQFQWVDEAWMPATSDVTGVRVTIEDTESSLAGTARLLRALVIAAAVAGLAVGSALILIGRTLAPVVVTDELDHDGAPTG